MKIAIGFDLHDTIVYSTQAWEYAFGYFAGDRYTDYISNYLKRKKSRKELSDILNVDYKSVEAYYHVILRKSAEMEKLMMILSDIVEVYIVTNASFSRAYRDLLYTGLLKYISKIYSREKGRKPDCKYIDEILFENQLDYFFFIGNDPKEDVFMSNRTISLLVDIYKLHNARD